MLLSHCRYIEVWGEVRQARVTDVKIRALKTRPQRGLECHKKHYVTKSILLHRCDMYLAPPPCQTWCRCDWGALQGAGRSLWRHLGAGPGLCDTSSGHQWDNAGDNQSTSLVTRHMGLTFPELQSLCKTKRVLILRNKIDLPPKFRCEIWSTGALDWDLEFGLRLQAWQSHKWYYLSISIERVKGLRLACKCLFQRTAQNDFCIKMSQV